MILKGKGRATKTGFSETIDGVQISCISSCGSVSESGETPVGLSVGNRAFYVARAKSRQTPSAEFYVAIDPVFYVINA